MKPASWVTGSENPKRKPTDKEPNHVAETNGLESEESFSDSRYITLFDSARKQRYGQKICGRVVRYDTAKACISPISGAVVRINSVQASFLGFFPREVRWSWFFPLFSSSDSTKQVKTDSDGRFSFDIPGRDIDKMVRFRRYRATLSDIFTPTLKNVLEGILLLNGRNELLCSGARFEPIALTDENSLSQCQEILGREIACLLKQELERCELDTTRPGDSLLDVPMRSSLNPPLLEKCLSDARRQTGEQLVVLHRSLNDVGTFDHVLDRFEGPFLRRRQSCLPEWLPIFDVPDVAFEVTPSTQKSAGNELLYSGHFFDVGWTAGDIPPVTLVVDRQTGTRKIAGAKSTKPNL